MPYWIQNGSNKLVSCCEAEIPRAGANFGVQVTVDLTIGRIRMAIAAKCPTPTRSPRHAPLVYPTIITTKIRHA